MRVCVTDVDRGDVVELAEEAPTRARVVVAVLLVWVLIIGVDFFLHAGVLAWAWTMPSPFLLRAEDLAIRIPLGYTAFLLTALLVVWLVYRLQIRRPVAGLWFGMKLGGLVALAGAFGLLSISTITLLLAAVWVIAQTAYVMAAGYLAAAVLTTSRLRPLVVKTAAVTGGLVICGIIAQNVIASI
jgi:hypothetical protein